MAGRVAAAACLAFLAAGALAHELPRGAPRMEFTPPQAGSYDLARIQQAPNGAVLDAQGRRGALAHYLTGKVTLLSLFYSQCADPDGCPLAFSAMVELRDRLAAHSARKRVRLVSLSFDPAHDTPAVLAKFGGHLPGKGVEWAFLTFPSAAAAAPVIEDLGQDVAVVTDGTRGSLRVISHVLKLFLIDRHGMVREIYTTAFLHPEVVYNDILTLLIEDDAAP